MKVRSIELNYLNEIFNFYFFLSTLLQYIYFIADVMTNIMKISNIITGDKKQLMNFIVIMMVFLLFYHQCVIFKFIKKMPSPVQDLS